MMRWKHLIRSESGIIPMLLALILAAGAFIGLGTLMLKGSGAALKKTKSNSEQLVGLEKTIRAHVFLTRHLPCPADGDGDGASRAGCAGNNNDGVVPWVTLGITRDDATDPFGRLISYHVDPDLEPVNSNAAKICQGNDARAGTLRLNPSADTSLFVLISHGSNGFGGWLPIGRQTANPASALERENCSGSAVNPANVTCANPSAKDITQGPHQTDPAAANYFDDTVLAARSSDYNDNCPIAAVGGGGGGGRGGGGNDRNNDGIPDHCQDGNGNDTNAPGCN